MAISDVLRLLPLLLSLTTFPQKIFAQDGLYITTCYDFNGLPYPNNTQCPGSAMCCGPLDQCIPDRLCQRMSDPATMVVGPCSVYPWDGSCTQICHYGRNPQTGLLPRAVNCTDGSFCCDDDPSCCPDKRGVFLNGLGVIVSTDGPSTATSTTSSTSSKSTSTVTNTPALSTTAVSVQSSSSSPSTLSSAAKAGISIGVAFLVLGLAALVTFIYFGRKRKQQRRVGSAPVFYPQLDGRPVAEPHYSAVRHEMEGHPGWTYDYNKTPAVTNTIYEMPTDHNTRMNARM